VTHLVVLGLDNRDDAERVFDLTGDLAASSCSSSRTRPTPSAMTRARSASHQAVNLTGAGASCWGP
jgi:hypothetical protein